MKQLKILFDPNQISNAAHYLEQHNTLCNQSAEYWEESIYNSIKYYVKRSDIACMGTGGYLIKFSEIDLDVVDVEVYIDPSVGKDRNVIEASYAFGKIIKEF